MTRLTGTVKGKDGRPLAEAAVLFVAGPVPLPEIAQLTGPDGQFSLAAPAPGAYRVQVMAPGHVAVTIGIEVGDETEIEQDIALS
jgi:hypothetical protein